MLAVLADVINVLRGHRVSLYCDKHNSFNELCLESSLTTLQARCHSITCAMRSVGRREPVKEPLGVGLSARRQFCVN